MEELKLATDKYLPLRDVVFQTLREAILRGTIKPGERLMEIQLSQQLGVSRTPVREAIRMLELEGLVNMTPPERRRSGRHFRKEPAGRAGGAVCSGGTECPAGL